MEAKDTKNKFVIKHSNKVNNNLYNKDQLSVLVGTILGDGYINKNGQVSISHSEKQKSYIDFMQTILGGNIITRINTGFGTNKIINVLTLPVNEQTKELRKICYPDGKKTLINIKQYIDEKSLAMLYMDDGSLSKTGQELRISTEGYSYDDHLIFVEIFKKYNIDINIRTRKIMYKKVEKTYNYISMNNVNRDKFLKLIAPYMHQSMSYKTLRSLDNVIQSYKFDTKHLDISSSKIVDVVYKPNLSSRLYDIEVENDHNFVSNGVVVHNCQLIQDIGLKTWLCPWMKLNHVGTYVFGGSLADLAMLGASATADAAELDKYKKR